MPRDRDDSTSSGGQSKRPPLNPRDSDTTSDNSGAHHHHHRRGHHQKQHHVRGLHHARAPAAKAAQKAPKLNRRHTTDIDELARQAKSEASSAAASASASASGTTTNHRRAASDAKLSSRESSSANLNKSPSHSKLKRNRSHVEIGKRNRSSDKLKRSASNTVVYSVKGNKTQVHFDLGTDGQEDEWVDASGSNSPYLSRKGSINSGQSSLRPSASANGSGLVTPSEPASPKNQEVETQKRERAQHKEYLTSRLLQRTPSQGAPPKMTEEIAHPETPRQFSPASTEARNSMPFAGSSKDELISRFVEAPGSGLTSEGSFYRPQRGGFQGYEEGARRPRSVISLPPARDDSASATDELDEKDDSALVPKTARRKAVPRAETSRTQQKLNLQRASSVIEPGQAMGGVGGVIGASPLIGVKGPGYDGGNSRDPRVGKLLERTGMEYLVVRRHLNPVCRSVNRLYELPGMEKSKRIPVSHAASVNGKRPNDLAMRHTRNVSMPDARRPVTPKRPTSIRTNGAASSYEGGEDGLAERLSGSSLVGGDEEDNTAALLRNLWEKSMELSASAD